MLLRAGSHRNGCPRRPLARLQLHNHWGKIRRREPLSRQKEPLILPLPSHSDGKYRWLGTGVQLFLPRRFILKPPLEPSQVLTYRLPHRALPTLTMLAVLGCYRQQTFLLRQPALSVAKIHGPARTSYFAPMMLSRPL